MYIHIKMKIFVHAGYNHRHVILLYAYGHNKRVKQLLSIVAFRIIIFFIWL